MKQLKTVFVCNTVVDKDIAQTLQFLRGKLGLVVNIGDFVEFAGQYNVRIDQIDGRHGFEFDGQESEV